MITLITVIMSFQASKLKQNLVRMALQVADGHSFSVAALMTEGRR